MQHFAANMGVALARMEWMPPGRGLWSMGTDLIYDRGAMALYNCAYTDIAENWIEDICWVMDTLMYGVGVGIGPIATGLKLKDPDRTAVYVVPDTREGWVESIRKLLTAFLTGQTLPLFNYDFIRSKGQPIKTFGGIASGPDPLRELHEVLLQLCYRYLHQSPPYTEIQFKTDLANLVGVCVITGNVRRSAEIALGEADDETFKLLKDYDIFPERASWGWMSNNTVKLREPKHFEMMDEIAHANVKGRDVGYVNMRNLPHGRIGKLHDIVPVDAAVGLNPCGEIPLESREVCNLAETLPTRCVDEKRWLQACEYATFYCSTVALLPTHQPTTNAIVGRNRRIGVSIVDISGWLHTESTSIVISSMRKGYKCVRETNKRLANEAGIPPSIRVTTVKPGGTTPKLPGRTSGLSNPTFRHTLRRINVPTDSPIAKRLKVAGIPSEPSAYTKATTIFEFPIIQGPADPVTEVCLWEQAMRLVLVQREWADNAVSNTLYFRPMWVLAWSGNLNVKDEHYNPRTGFLAGLTETPLAIRSSYENGDNEMRKHDLKILFSESSDYKIYQYDPQHEEAQLENVLAAIAPYTKSVSLLPHSTKGAFKQMPEEGLTPAEYNLRVHKIRTIDWSSYSGTDGIDEKYCTGDHCEVPQ
jgi:ribonucleoside-diphosphate reductase alpha chain